MDFEANILIVDDDDVVINIINNILSRDHYKTDHCHSGEEALQKVSEKDFDLVLLDLHMGKGMDGYEACKLLHQTRPELPVILVTANQDDESVNRGFEAGSADYIKKPVSRLELLARVNNTITLKQAERKNLQLIETLQKDLNIAANIQQAMLPKWIYLDRKIMFSSYYEPCETIGGDLFDHIKLSDDKYVIYIGDISGHGVQAALLMSAIKSTIRLMIESSEDSKSMARLFTELNARLYNDLFMRNNYLTLLMGVIDLQAQEFRFLNAGHPPPLRLDTIRNEVHIMDEKGSLPLGWLPGTVYQDAEIERIPLVSTDIFLVFTDGIYECTNSDMEQFGIQGLKNLLDHEICLDSCISLPYKIQDYLERKQFEMGADDFSLFSFQAIQPDGMVKYPEGITRRHHLFMHSALKDVANTALECEKVVLAWTRDYVLAAKAELIVDEFLNNIVAYGYKYQEASEIVIEFKVVSKILSIRFWDKGIEWIPHDLCFNIDNPYNFDLDGMEMNGRGIKIILSICNRFNRIRFGSLNETQIEIEI